MCLSHSLEITEIPSFLQKFRENNGFTKEITKQLNADFTKYFSCIELAKAHSVEIMGILSHAFLQKFRESNGFTK